VILRGASFAWDGEGETRPEPILHDMELQVERTNFPSGGSTASFDSHPPAFPVPEPAMQDDACETFSLSRTAIDTYVMSANTVSTPHAMHRFSPGSCWSSWALSGPASLLCWLRCSERCHFWRCACSLVIVNEAVLTKIVKHSPTPPMICIGEHRVR
jgi:hypothetical protein